MIDLNECIVLIEVVGESATEFGTGFVVHYGVKGAYVVTSAHVVESSTGGATRVLVAGCEATEVLLAADGPDLAVVIVRDLRGIPICPVQEPREQTTNFSSSGFQEDEDEKNTYEPVRCTGTLDCSKKVIRRNGTQLSEFWKLPLRDIQFPDSITPRGGYSGAPLFDSVAGAAVGVFRRSSDVDRRADGVSITHLHDVCPDVAQVVLAEKRNAHFEKAVDNRLHWMDLECLELLVTEIQGQRPVPPAALILVHNLDFPEGAQHPGHRVRDMLLPNRLPHTVRFVEIDIAVSCVGGFQGVLDLLAADLQQNSSWPRGTGKGCNSVVR